VWKALGLGIVNARRVVAKRQARDKGGVGGEEDSREKEEGGPQGENTSTYPLEECRRAEHREQASVVVAAAVVVESGSCKSEEDSPGSLLLLGVLCLRPAQTPLAAWFYFCTGWFDCDSSSVIYG
jgi:hypothetical protein